MLHVRSLFVACAIVIISISVSIGQEKSQKSPADKSSGQPAEKTVEQVKKKKNPNALPKVQFESFKEGTAAQIMYVGPFSAEGPTITKIHAYIQNSGHMLSGKHHEIYLNSPATTAPEKLKTIIRQPMV